MILCFSHSEKRERFLNSFRTHDRGTKISRTEVRRYNRHKLAFRLGHLMSVYERQISDF